MDKAKAHLDLEKFTDLNCTEDDLAVLFDMCDFSPSDLNPNITIYEADEEEPPFAYIPECEYIGGLSTNDVENCGPQVLLITSLLKLLMQGRLTVEN
jgi:hypothetical protein